jgi:outer membrane lipopolysaccharide assembly protein LptE/RlpB
MRLNKVSYVLLLFLLLSCVKYSFRGALPSYLKNIYIQDFEDRTNYPGLREEFMQKVTEAFISDNSLQVINDRDAADLILNGTINSVQRRPVSITPQEQVQEFQMVVTIRAECMNTHTGKPLWTGNLSRYGIISGDALRDEIDLAKSQAVDQIVEDIISQTIGAW